MQLRPAIVAGSLFVLFTLVTACGSTDNGTNGSGAQVATEEDTRVFDRDAILSVDDLVSLGLKSGREYDVSTLPGGVASRVMFWRVKNVAVEYEVRFYESHALAVELGTGPAEEGSGEDANLDARTAQYTEGIRDRRTIFDFRGVPKPKYGAYAIYGNMVVLCEGKDDGEGWDRCEALIEALDAR